MGNGLPSSLSYAEQGAYCHTLRSAQDHVVGCTKALVSNLMRFRTYELAQNADWFSTFEGMYLATLKSPMNSILGCGREHQDVGR